jgi:hypothetical protein
MGGFSGGYTTGYGEVNVADVWLDYSLSRPTDAQLAAAKTFGVCRYLSVVNELTTKKIIWQAEYNHLLDLGIAIHLNYEWYEGRVGEGNSAGQIDGSTALTQAKALGYPKGLPITFSDDTVGTPLTAIKNYLTGVKAGLSGYYRIGYYGPRVKMDAVLISGHAVFGWQPTAWAGQDANGQPIQSNLAHLFQYFGGAPIPQTDLNKVLREPPFPWYDGGEPMPTAQEIADAVWAKQLQSEINPAKTFSAGFMLASTNKDANDAEKAAKAVPTADEIAAAVVAKLPANPGGGATPAEVKQAVLDALTGAPLIPSQPSP